MNPFNQAWLINKSGDCIEVYAHPSESFEFDSIVDIVLKYGSELDKNNCNDWKSTKSETSKAAILDSYNQNWCRVRLWKDNKLTFRIASADYNWYQIIVDFLRAHPYVSTANITVSDFFGKTYWDNKDVKKAKEVLHGTDAKIKTGFNLIDDTFGGFRKGEVVLLAAPYGIGNRDMAFDILIHNAIQNDVPVLYVSLYERSFAIACKLVGHMNGKHISSSFGIDAPKIQENCEQLQKHPICIRHQYILDMDTLLELVCSLEPDYPELIIVDRIGCPDMSKEESGEIMTLLNKVADITNTCIIVLSNVSHNVDNRENHRPLPSDLPVGIRMMDYVITMYSEDLSDDNLSGLCEMHIDVIDNNLGITEVGRLGYSTETTRFIQYEVNTDMSGFE